MTANSDKTPVPGSTEYHNHVDRRKRAKQRTLTSSHAGSENFEDSDGSRRHGKIHQVQFKVSPLVWETGEKVAGLYGLSLSKFAKAILYQNLAIYESTDKRKKKRK